MKKKLELQKLSIAKLTKLKTITGGTMAGTLFNCSGPKTKPKTKCMDSEVDC